MANHSSLLDLPFELRDMIWTFSSSTGDANGLLRCCRQIRDEFTPYCILSKDVHQLHRLRIWVDSTHDHGIWLKFDYTWEENGYMHRAIDSVCDMDDPIVQKLMNICRVKETIVHLHAPRRGHFVGALFMMLAKADDAYNMIQTMSRHVDLVQADMGHTSIIFSTQSPQPDQSTKEAKNFWECRSIKALQEPIRKYLHNSGQMPYFYEYFLINNPYRFPRPPTVEYLTWPRRHAYRHEPLRTEVIQKCLRLCERKREKALALDILMPGCDVQRNIAIHSAKMMTGLRDSMVDISNFSLVTDRWEHINYDTANLKSRFQFWLDNLAGPVGGCLDMLRLHRFKTMDESVANFFSRQARKARNARGLAGAATEINRCLRTLFNPVTTEWTRHMRNSCSHLRAVSWATGYSSPSQKLCHRALWLKHYPSGIRGVCTGQRRGSTQTGSMRVTYMGGLFGFIGGGSAQVAARTQLAA
ncbi:hypothetical protein NW762_004507 [Fusarium torreyae]|uniref:F-box domain-containing protein n=1 Tax=Fusarium torreyae TaxID=1237075 RepID=A0A9W8S956_9HYPO|nr:hypothetical protein NW762_004507 [Fusarium torreyae]